MSTFIDVHALQTLPPSNINRDDTGSPKTATFGGVPRQRVTSQAWKHAMRHHLSEALTPDQMGVRTKRVVQKIAARVQQLDGSWDSERAKAEAEALLKAGGIKVELPKKKKAEEAEPETGYLLFLSNHQITAVAQAIIDADGEKISKVEARKLLNDQHSVDIALFGRMVADDPFYNVDASAQVAHALGVAESEPEFDFFTAVDDVVKDAEETGAGMMGTVEMMSSTLYRYATLNLDALATNLDDRETAIKVARFFVESFLVSMPTGKQNTFANRTLPDAIVVSVRRDRPVSLINAFEVPATGKDGGYRLQAAQKMAQHAKDIDTAYGYQPVATWVVALPQLVGPLEELGTVTNLPQLLDQLTAVLAEEEGK